MAPPTATEQLIRDYLNRLSVAARDLAPDDRRALLERIRGYIEQKADKSRRPSTMEVGRVLARLGNPATLVEQERRRLAAQGKAVSQATSATGRQRFLARARGRDQGRPRGSGFPWSALRDNGGSVPPAPSNGVADGVHRPATPGASETRDAATTGGGVTARPADPTSPSPPASASEPAARPAGSGGPAPAERPAAGSSDSSGNGAVPAALTPTGAESATPQRPATDASHDSGAHDEPASATQPAVGTEGSHGDAATPADPAPASVTESADAKKSAAGGTSAATPRPRTAKSRWWRRVDLIVPDGPVRRQLVRLLAWVRRRPLEAAAVVLMGIGGPVFPPVFLIGATLALASELWDGRDKWVGIALPIVLTVIGLAVGIAAGGRAHWQHESWVYLEFVSRIAPALGAGYLAWRTERPRRPPTVPPFSRPRRA